MRRGAVVREVKQEGLPTVVVEGNGQVEEIQARLVVGADGRTSATRKWGDFMVRRDPEQRFVSGVLFEEMPVPEDVSYLVLNPSIGQHVPLFP